MEGANFEGIHSRLVKAVGSSKLKDIAECLEISEQAVSQALKKQRIPATWIYKISTKTNFPSDWLLYGSGALDTEDTDANAAIGSSSGCKRCLELYEKLDQANERLFQVMQENGNLKETIGKLNTELVQLKNAHRKPADDENPMSSSS